MPEFTAPGLGKQSNKVTLDVEVSEQKYFARKNRHVAGRKTMVDRICCRHLAHQSSAPLMSVQIQNLYGGDYHILDEPRQGPVEKLGI